jgi:FkbM family methyltransferase
MGDVIAVEANRTLEPHFRRQLSLNGVALRLVHALGCPLWDGEIPEEIRSQSFSAAESNLSGRAGGAGTGDSVPWLTLKEIALAGGMENPTVLMLDVEGGEQVWCDRPPGLPASMRTVIVEVHPHLTGEVKAGRCVQALINEGFSVAAISGTVLGLVR